MAVIKCRFHILRGVGFIPSGENKNISNTYYLIEETINLQFIINFKPYFFRNITMNTYIKDLVEAQITFSERYDDENVEALFEAEIQKGLQYEFMGCRVSIWDDFVYSNMGIAPDFAIGMAWMPNMKCIVLNTGAANLPTAELHAMLAHEVGHSVLGHTEIVQASEMEADAYSASLGYDIKTALTNMRAELIRYGNTTEIPVDLSVIDERINNLN